MGMTFTCLLRVLCMSLCTCLFVCVCVCVYKRVRVCLCVFRITCFMFECGVGRFCVRQCANVCFCVYV